MLIVELSTLADSVWMENSMLKTVRVCFPEQKNLYNRIFGGFLMRQAFELAWANACVYSKNVYDIICTIHVVENCKSPINLTIELMQGFGAKCSVSDSM